MGPQRLAHIALLLLSLSPTVGAAQSDFIAVDEAASDAVISGEIPGVVVLVGLGDEVLLHRAYGWRRLVPEPAPMTPDTIFDIASLTKPFGTTLAVMSLVERLRRQHVALDALDRLDAPEVGLRASTHEASHDVALPAQRLDDRAADEPGRAGDEHPMHRTHLDPTIPVLRS